MFKCQYCTNDDNHEWGAPTYCEKPATWVIQYKEHAGTFINGNQTEEACDWFTIATCDEHKAGFTNDPTTDVEYHEMRLQNNG